MRTLFDVTAPSGQASSYRDIVRFPSAPSGQLVFAAVVAALVILGGRALEPVPMPGSYWEALGVGAASALLAFAYARIRRRPFPLDRLPSVLVVSVAARAFFDAFLRWKAVVAEAGFHWDSRLARLDAFLHGGPAARLLPSSEPILRVFDAAYYIWFPVLTAGILYWAWHPDARRRARFAVAFVVTWVLLGIVFAMAFSSAGPIFADFPVLPDTGTAAMRDALWLAYQAGQPTSISAMPSLHVAVPVLYGFSVRGWMRRLMWVYAGIIFLGSVALGWHWAVDGYAAALLVAFIWWRSGFTRARRHMET